MTKRATPVDKFVGQRLRLRRKMLGLSQEKLGESVGVTFQQIQKYENGANRIGAGRLSEFATLLEVPTSYFFPERGADESGPTSIQSSELLSVAGALDLVRAYARIEDVSLRKVVLSLVRQLAKLGADVPATSAQSQLRNGQRAKIGVRRR